MMKRKMIFAAVFAAVMLVSGVCSAGVSTRTISESEMKMEWKLNYGSMAIYVKGARPAEYTEYSSRLPGYETALEISMMTEGTTVEAYTTNEELYMGLLACGEVELLARTPLGGGIDSSDRAGEYLYWFTFTPYEPVG